MIIGYSDIWEGNQLKSEICIMQEETRIIQQTMSIQTYVSFQSDVIEQRDKIFTMLHTVYPNSTLLAEGTQTNGQWLHVINK